MREHFCGWYFKCQSGDEALAFIPAVHRGQGKQSGSLQIISREKAWNIPLSEECRVQRDQPRAVLGKSVFDGAGIQLNLQTPELCAEGALQFGPPSPLRYDIMGPFCCLPWMECRHQVFSMRHSVNGRLRINGQDYCFQDGLGYIEGDRGRSFPSRYIWTQCCFEEGSLVLAVAEIPLGPIRFTGVIAAVCLQGAEYRLATYLGARADCVQRGQVTVSQGDLTLTASLLEGGGRSLRAPMNGVMNRSIREHVACCARYRFTKGCRTLLALETSEAAFEYEY